jgi:uncharacterized glyoxalase superfamily protein PhnB
MTSPGPRPASHIVPLMRYRDVGVASEWLCAVFGFAPHFAAKAPDGAVFYAELQAGESMIMLGAEGEPSLDAVMSAPSSTGQGPTQSCYVVVEDVRGHYAHAKEAGIEIVLDLKSDDRGGAGYSCKDPEGHIWNFGSYDPRTAQGAATRQRPTGRRGRGMASAVVLTLILSAVSGWFAYSHVRGGEGLSIERIKQALLAARDQGLATGTISPSDPDSRAARAETTRAQRAMAALKDELERERAAKAQALAAASAARVEASKATQDKARVEARVQASEATRAATPKLGAATRDDIQATRSAVERSEATLGELRAEVKAMQESLHQAQEAQKSAEAARTLAETSVAEERAAKDAALQALADAGARIARLEQDVAAAKSAQASRSLKRMRAVSAVRATARAKPKPKRTKTELSWPYSSW